MAGLGRYSSSTCTRRPAAAAAAATVAAASASRSSSGSGPWASLASLANALTNFFPVFVLGAAALGLARPSAYDFFSPAAITPSLAVTMLGMGLTLTFEVGPLPTKPGTSDLAWREVQAAVWQMHCAAARASACGTSAIAPWRASSRVGQAQQAPLFLPTLQDFKRVLTTPGRIFAGFALQYTIMPAAAFAVSRLAGLPLAFTIG